MVTPVQWSGDATPHFNVPKGLLRSYSLALKGSGNTTLRRGEAYQEGAVVPNDGDSMGWHVGLTTTMTSSTAAHQCPREPP